jgi:ABC-2 type transport system permease protein
MEADSVTTGTPQIYLQLVLASLRANVQRPATLAGRGLGTSLISLVEALGMVLLLDRFGSIGGWRAPEVVLLLGLGSCGQALALAIGSRLEPDNISLLLRMGTFDQVLTRPMSPLGWVVSSYLEIRQLGKLLAGVGMLAWAGHRAGVDWTLTHLAVAVLAVACCAVVVFAILVAGAALTFYTVQGSEAVNVALFGGPYLSGYPMEIYGSATRFVFTWVLPFGLTIYVPTLTLLGRAGPPGLEAGLLWMTPLGTAWVASLAGIAWHRAIRHYVGTGS